MTEHAAFNRAIRAAAGHPGDDRWEQASPSESWSRGVALKPGDIGVGRGGSAAPHRRRATANEVVNARLRAGFRVVRSAALRDGLSIDLDDPWGQ
jgi:hypothetical protein